MLYLYYCELKEINENIISSLKGNIDEIIISNNYPDIKQVLKSEFNCNNFSLYKKSKIYDKLKNINYNCLIYEKQNNECEEIINLNNGTVVNSLYRFIEEDEDIKLKNIYDNLVKYGVVERSVNQPREQRIQNEEVKDDDEEEIVKDNDEVINALPHLIDDEDEEIEEVKSKHKPIHKCESKPIKHAINFDDDEDEEIEEVKPKPKSKRATRNFVDEDEIEEVKPKSKSKRVCNFDDDEDEIEEVKDEVKDNNVNFDVKTNDVKTNDVKTNDVKTNEVKTNEVKTNEVKTNEVKTNEVKDEVKTNEVKDETIEAFSDEIFEICSTNDSNNILTSNDNTLISKTAKFNDKYQDHLKEQLMKLILTEDIKTAISKINYNYGIKFKNENLNLIFKLNDEEKKLIKSLL